MIQTWRFGGERLADWAGANARGRHANRRECAYLWKMRYRHTPTVAATLAITWLPLVGQTNPEASVTWEPDQPIQGSFVHLVVNPDVNGNPGEWDGRVGGFLAGQPLHFERDRTGAFRALGAIPVSAAETIPLQITVDTGRDSSHHLIRIPVDPGNFRMERLSVSSRFSTAPDSALQERIRSESARSAAVSRTAHDGPRMWHGEWVRPRPTRVTSPFGTGRVFNGEVRSRHLGVDLNGETGDPIRAGNRGIVALVGDFYYAGNVVYIQHGAGLVTIYMHMSEVLVEEGDVVERGQLIGRVGATGRVTGPHLHWMGRYGSVSVDPLTLFELDSTAFPSPLPDLSR